MDVVREVQPAVKSCQNAGRLRAEQREVQIVYVEMQHVKVIGALAHLVEHQHEVRNRITRGLIKAQGAGRAGDKFGGGHRIGACEQRYPVSLIDQFLGQV